jgi:hypothetical protein
MQPEFLGIFILFSEACFWLAFKAFINLIE